MDPSNTLYVHPSDGPGSLPVHEKLLGASNYRSRRRVIEIGLSTKRKLGFVRAKSVMFIGSASEIWSQLETRFSLSNGSRKYKLCKDTFGISQQGSSVSEYYTRMKYIWEELDSLTALPNLATITPEITIFLNDVQRQKEEQRLFHFLNGLDECYSAQKSQLLLINPLPSVENACAVIQQEESQKDVFNVNVPVVQSTALYSKSVCKDKCSICSFKWNPPERCWEKVGYPMWHHKYKAQGKPNQSQSRSREVDKGRGNGFNSGQRKTAASVSNDSSSFTFTSEQFENLVRSVLKDMKPNAGVGDCTDDEIEFVAVENEENLTGENVVPNTQNVPDTNSSAPSTSSNPTNDVRSCVECRDYHIDVTCSFIPQNITHEAHSGHLLPTSFIEREPITKCLMCQRYFSSSEKCSFACDTCKAHLHAKCALLLPREIRHKYDKHPMRLSYLPVENHKSDYFCEICEDELNPEICFYHCYECAWSIHTFCAPHILQSETSIGADNYKYTGT
ncbi:hypothetical protein CTI12_AA503560 [Artemisia annua]|uniref:Phorbol-ester/DAG-type domain-containing protein n=1 Tax=Artemisia annua TaxID=35608 RepID=A0A2U1LDT0_ARTAN|nr:hypothetical protein CTI12_AA503560 [Artemisia annua]